MIVVIVVAIVLSIFRGLFVDQLIAVRALEKQGYENIQISEKDWFIVGLRGCDGKDAAKFVARATNSLKKEVELNVCVGWPFKGATIRTD